MTVGASQYADDILTMSTVTGMSTESLQAYKYAAELVDTSMETLTGSMARNIRSMNSAREGTGAASQAYKALGISITDANGNLRDSETVYWETIDALGNVANETERDALAMQLFGKECLRVKSSYCTRIRRYKSTYRGSQGDGGCYESGIFGSPR